MAKIDNARMTTNVGEVTLMGLSVNVLQEIIKNGSITKASIFRNEADGDPTYYTDMLDELLALEGKLATALMQATAGSGVGDQISHLFDHLDLKNAN